MFSKLSVVAALALVPWTQARIFLQIPVAWRSSSQVNVSWTHDAGDPIFSLQLARDIFHDTFSIANNVDPTRDFISLLLGVVPEGDYTLRAINVTNAGDIYDETPSFHIDGPPASSSGPSSPAATSRSSSSSAAASGSSSQGDATVTVPPRPSTTGFGVTVSQSSTPDAASQTAASTSSGDDSVPTNFNDGGNGAASLPRIAPLALAALGVVAGAAVAL